MKITSKLAAITSISSDEDSDSPDSNEDIMDVQLNNAGLPHNNIPDIPERVLRSWAPRPPSPLHGPNASGLDGDASSSSSDENDDEADEDEGMDEPDDYPEWDRFQTHTEGVPASDLLYEGYEQEVAAVGMSPFDYKNHDIESL